MSVQPTIALVPENPALAGALRDVRVLELDDRGDPADWVFVDSVLPDSSGFEFCRRLRARPATAGARVVIVLEDDDRELRRRALRAGADDYVVGPLTADHVLARVRVAAGHCASTAMAHGSLEIDRASFQTRVGGKLVALAPNEFNLLAYFMEHRDRLLSRRELIDALKNGGPPIDERTVDVWVGRLRRAFAAAGAQTPIRTVRSLGYVFDS